VNDFWRGQRLLVVMPHADDETFACAGTIGKVKDLGGEVYVVIASVGDLVHYDGQHQHVLGNTRADEVRSAMRLLGVDGYEVLFNDPKIHLRLDAVPRLDLINLIERDGTYAIDRVKPAVLILPALSYNQDHEVIFKAGFAACRPHLPDVKPFVRLVLSADAPQLAWSAEAFQPNFYVDISDYLARKLKAHACHQSQLRLPPHHASLEHLERLARVRGAAVSVGAAEAFFCHRFLT
jgi:LmbE family N-acetylglucosaminyl deacetylase